MKWLDITTLTFTAYPENFPSQLANALPGTYALSMSKNTCDVSYVDHYYKTSFEYDYTNKDIRLKCSQASAREDDNFQTNCCYKNIRNSVNRVRKQLKLISIILNFTKRGRITVQTSKMKNIFLLRLMLFMCIQVLLVDSNKIGDMKHSSWEIGLSRSHQFSFGIHIY